MNGVNWLVSISQLVYTYILLSVDSRESCAAKKCEADVEQTNWPTLAGYTIVKDGGAYQRAYTPEMLTELRGVVLCSKIQAD